MKILKPQAVRKIFREYLREAGCKENTIRTKMRFAEVFLSYLDPELDVRDIGIPVIEGFVDYLSLAKSRRTGRPLAKRTRQAVISAMKMIFVVSFRRT